MKHDIYISPLVDTTPQEKPSLHEKEIRYPEYGMIVVKYLWVHNYYSMLHSVSPALALTAFSNGVPPWPEHEIKIIFCCVFCFS
jgi:hypothetical protein